MEPRDSAQVRVDYLLRVTFPGMAWQSLVATAGGQWLVAAAMRPYVFALVLASIVRAVIALCFIYLVRSDAPYGRPPTRPIAWQFGLRTLLLLPLWLWLLLMAFFPKLMTGDFCNVRIDKLSVHTDGHVRFSYTKRTSGGTGMNVRFVPGGGGFQFRLQVSKGGPARGLTNMAFTSTATGSP